MDTRITPFGVHPDGGTIKEFSSIEEMPDYMLPLSSEAVKILENIPIPERVNYVLRSTEPELWKAREFLKKRIAEEYVKESNRLRDALGLQRLY